MTIKALGEGTCDSFSRATDANAVRCYVQTKHEIAADCQRNGTLDEHTTIGA